MEKKSWTKIAQELGRRSDVQCRYHFRQINPKGLPPPKLQIRGMQSLPAQLGMQKFALPPIMNFMNKVHPSGSYQGSLRFDHENHEIRTQPTLPELPPINFNQDLSGIRQINYVQSLPVFPSVNLQSSSSDYSVYDVATSEEMLPRSPRIKSSTPWEDVLKFGGDDCQS